MNIPIVPPFSVVLFMRTPHTISSDAYYPDDVGSQDGLLYKLLKTKLQPKSSPPPDEFDSKDAEPVPLQSDAVLIGFSDGKASEVAHEAATDILSADDKELKVRVTYNKSDHMIDLEALAACDLNLIQ
jgi:hypothetical protein